MRVRTANWASADDSTVAWEHAHPSDDAVGRTRGGEERFRGGLFVMEAPAAGFTDYTTVIGTHQHRLSIYPASAGVAHQLRLSIYIDTNSPGRARARATRAHVAGGPSFGSEGYKHVALKFMNT